MNTYSIYGTIVGGEEEHMYVFAHSKAEALAYVEEEFGSSFFPEYIVLEEPLNIISTQN